MTELSPAAQAVLDAVEDDCIHPNDKHKLVAAALRAVADQVAPSQKNYEEASHEFAVACLNGMAYSANELRCIAEELEGAQ